MTVVPVLGGRHLLQGGAIRQSGVPPDSRRSGRGKRLSVNGH